MKKQVIWGYPSNNKLAEFMKPTRVEQGEQHRRRGVKILRVRRVYDLKPRNYYFKSPNKIVKYYRVKITIERING